MDFRSILMGVSFSLIWSSAFTSAKILVTAASPLMVLSLRFLISGLLGIAIARMLGQKIQLNREEWTVVVIIGISQNALYLAFNFIAMQWIEASLGFSWRKNRAQWNAGTYSRFWRCAGHHAGQT